MTQFPFSSPFPLLSFSLPFLTTSTPTHWMEKEEPDSVSPWYVLHILYLPQQILLHTAFRSFVGMNKEKKEEGVQWFPQVLTLLLSVSCHAPTLLNLKQMNWKWAIFGSISPSVDAVCHQYTLCSTASERATQKVWAPPTLLASALLHSLTAYWPPCVRSPVNLLARFNRSDLT